MTHTHISPFTAVEGAPTADLDTVGGKGLSLARLTAYARVGVPEYWVVDPEERDVTRHVLEGGVYREAGRRRDEIAFASREVAATVDLVAVWPS